MLKLRTRHWHSLRWTVVVAMLLISLVSRGAESQQTPTIKTEKSKPGVTISNPPGVLLRVSGDGIETVDITAESLAKLPRRSLRAKRHDGVESTYEGVPLDQILAFAKIPHGDALRGPALGLYVVAEAADGYKAVFSIAEIDPTFTDRTILVADRRDGQSLSAREGPLQIIVPGEKKHARWVRQLLRLKVVRS